MLKFGIRQAGVVDGGQKTRNPLPNPTSRPKKRLKAPEIPPRPPGGARRHPAGARRLPGGPREAPAGLRGAPKLRTPQPFQEVAWKFGTRQAGAVDGSQKTRNPLPNPTCRPKKKAQIPGLRGAPGTTDTPRAPGGPRTVSELQRPQQEKPTTFPEDPERVSKRSRQDLGSKPGR